MRQLPAENISQTSGKHDHNFGLLSKPYQAVRCQTVHLGVSGRTTSNFLQEAQAYTMLAMDTIRSLLGAGERSARTVKLRISTITESLPMIPLKRVSSRTEQEEYLSRTWPTDPCTLRYVAQSLPLPAPNLVLIVKRGVAGKPQAASRKPHCIRMMAR